MPLILLYFIHCTFDTFDIKQEKNKYLHFYQMNGNFGMHSLVVLW